MKAKTIREHLKNKIEDWANSIEDDLIRSLVRENTIVTGGCIASMLLKEPVNDYDVYFRDKETALAVAMYYLNRFKPAKKNGIECKMHIEDKDDRIKIIIKSAGIASEKGTDREYEYFETRPEDEAAAYVGEVMGDPGDIEDAYDALETAALATENEDDRPPYRPVFISTNAITLSDKIQIVLRFWGEPDDIHENYDFMHCTNYWTSRDKGELVLKKNALECLLSKELRYIGSKYPVCSLFRIRKFIHRGWTINAGHILKMAMQISELDLMDIKTLEDQLTGVDCAYFCEVISKVKDKDQNATKIESAYLVEIIDRMFE